MLWVILSKILLTSCTFNSFNADSIIGKTTAFPCGLAIAATFDVDIAYKWGEAMGNEFLLKGSHVQLGPGLNVARIPHNGRNFEYLSGEGRVKLNTYFIDDEYIYSRHAVK